MPSPFSSSQLWKRQLERATTPGASTTVPVMLVLAASILRQRPKEMKKLLTGTRKNADPITPKLLASTARRYCRHGSVVAEVARCLRDQNHSAEALATLRTHHGSCTDPTPLLKPWHELIRTASGPSPSDFKAFQQSLERGIRDTADDPEQQRTLCQFWIDHRCIFPEKSTVAPQVKAFLTANLPTSLATADRDLLTYVLSRSPTPSSGSRATTKNLSALPADSALLFVCSSRTSLTSLQPVVDQLQAGGHPVRTFCLDCLDRRDIYWSDHAGTRTHKEPGYTFLGDQRLSSLRLLATLLESHAHTAVPTDDSALGFLDGLPGHLRPQSIYTTAPV